MCKGIQSITLPSVNENDPIVVTSQLHINEFIKNADKTFFNLVQTHLEGQREKFQLKPLIATASPEEIAQGVPETYEVPITFDQSNFFE